MRILFVARRYPPDVQAGTETAFAALVRQAGLFGHDTRLVAGWTRDRSLIPEDALGVDLRGRGTGAAQFAIWRAARGEIARWKPDVVFTNTIEAPVTRVPTIGLIHDLHFGKTQRYLSTVLREALTRARAARFARVIVPSIATRDALVALGLSRIDVIPLGVDLDRFVPPAARPVNDPVELLCPGRILPGKAQHVAIDAVARLNVLEKKRVILRIVGVAGDAIYLDQLKVQSYRQPVVFEPADTDLAAAYARSDLVVLPSLLHEGFGVAATEAMACGRPVIWTDQPGVREATAGIGFPVPPDDAVAIRDLIRAFLKDPAPFLAAGAAGRAHVAPHHGWGEVWRHVERVLAAL